MNQSQSTRTEAPGLADGPRVFTKQQVMELLGIKKTTYHKLIAPDARGRVMLLSSRLYPGGPRRHTQEQVEAYLRYLNNSPVAGGVASEIQNWKSRKSSHG